MWSPGERSSWCWPGLQTPARPTSPAPLGDMSGEPGRTSGQSGGPCSRGQMGRGQEWQERAKPLKGKRRWGRPPKEVWGTQQGRHGSTLRSDHRLPVRRHPQQEPHHCRRADSRLHGALAGAWHLAPCQPGEPSAHIWEEGRTTVTSPSSQAVVETGCIGPNGPPSRLGLTPRACYLPAAIATSSRTFQRGDAPRRRSHVALHT